MDLRAFLEPTNPIGLAWMVVLFVGVVFWAFGKRRRRHVSRPPPGDHDDA